MTIGKKFLATALCACALVGFAGCSKKTETENVSISLSETAIELVVGETKELKASVTPTDAMDKKILWKSSDEKIVVVDGGMITAKEEGKATITAIASGKSTTCEVSVKAKKGETKNQNDTKTKDEKQNKMRK